MPKRPIASSVVKLGRILCNLRIYHLRGGVSNYDASNVLGKATQPREVQRLCRSYAASYSENAVLCVWTRVINADAETDEISLNSMEIDFYSVRICRGEGGSSFYLDLNIYAICTPSKIR